MSTVNSQEIAAAPSRVKQNACLGFKRNNASVPLSPAAQKLAPPPHEQVSYIRTLGEKSSFDCRRMQIFGISASELEQALVAKIVSPKQLKNCTTKCLSKFPSRIIIRRGTIDNVLEAWDHSTFDVALFFDSKDPPYQEFLLQRSRSRGSLKKAMAADINQQSSQSLKNHKN